MTTPPEIRSRWGITPHNCTTTTPPQNNEMFVGAGAHLPLFYDNYPTRETIELGRGKPPTTSRWPPPSKNNKFFVGAEANTSPNDDHPTRKTIKSLVSFGGEPPALFTTTITSENYCWGWWCEAHQNMMNESLKLQCLDLVHSWETTIQKHSSQQTGIQTLSRMLTVVGSETNM